MAFTTFGTGLGAVAQGNAYVPNWGQEQQALIQLGNTIQGYWANKERLAKETAENLRTVVLPNKADQQEYDKFSKETLLQIDKLTKSNPDYFTNPTVWAKYKTMASQLQDNDIVRRAANLDAQKKAFLEHSAKDPGFYKTDAYRDNIERLKVRTEDGVDAYRSRFKEQDYAFNAPEKFDYAAQFKSFANRFLRPVANIESNGKFSFIHEKTSLAEADNATRLYISMYPDQSQDYVDRWNKDAHPDNQLSLFEAIKQGIVGSATIEDKISGLHQNWDYSDAYRKAEIDLRTQEFNYKKQKDEVDRMSPIQRAMHDGNYVNNAFLPFGLLYTQNNLGTDDKGKPIYGPKRYIGSKLSIIQFDEKGKPYVKPIDPNALQGKNIDIIIPKGSRGTLIPVINAINKYYDMEWAGQISIDEATLGTEAYEQAKKDLKEMTGIEPKETGSGSKRKVSNDIRAYNSNININSLSPGYNAVANQAMQKGEIWNEPAINTGEPETPIGENKSQSATNSKTYTSDQVLSMAKNKVSITDAELQGNFIDKTYVKDGVTYRLYLLKDTDGNWYKPR